MDKVLAYLEPWEVAAWHHSRQAAGRALDDSLAHPVGWLAKIATTAILLLIAGRILRGSDPRQSGIGGNSCPSVSMDRVD